MPNPSLSKIKLNGVEYELKDAVARQGLDNIYIVNVTVTSLSEETFTSDKTHTEILNAVNAGKVPFVKTSFGGLNVLAPLTHIDSEHAIFTYINQLDEYILIKYAQIKITNNIAEIQTLNDNFALSAAIPTLTSELTNNSGFITSENDPIFSSSAAASITSNDIANWNNILSLSYVSSFNGETGDITYIAPVTSVNGQTGVVNLDANDVGALPNDTPIPAAVTEQTVSDWGFTKNTGTYSKPSSGIPKSDLSSAVQTSLGKADTALQSVPSTYRTASAQDIIDDAQDTAIANKLAINGNAYRTSSIPMGKVDSTSTATEFTATIGGITELRNGVCMWLTNGVITSASGFTININNLGAKPCYSSNAAATQSTTIFNINYTLLMIYNEDRVTGGCWDIVYGIDTNTSYTPYSLGFGYGTSTTAEATIAKVASVSSSYKLVAGGIVSIKFTNDVPANSTLNVNSKGAKAIYYRGDAITDGVIKGGDTATFIYSTYYHLISVDRDEKLPAVTTTDNGKFLCVINGAWSATTVPSAETTSF